MNTKKADIVIVGAGPVGLLCAYLAQLCGLHTITIDKSSGPLKVGRADALNARTLQLLELVGLFDELYPLGKPCKTSSVWKDEKFISRDSSWWDELEGCLHKHFLMVGQSHVEKRLDERLRKIGSDVRRLCRVAGVEITEKGCLTTLSTGEKIESRYVIGADGSRSIVRESFKIPFEIVRPEIVWAVIDGIIETDFQKVPEIISFQSETSDVAWIPREGKIDRFYVRMDSMNFTFEDALVKMNHAIHPHSVKFKKIEWYSHFSVKESVAEKFFAYDRIFLAGDACHIHSVNGGQGLNTGLADAFNLIWKLNRVLRFGASTELLRSYEDERRPVAKNVIKISGELARSTKNSPTGTHAEDYVAIVRKHAGYITGMGIRYGNETLRGTRLFDFEVHHGDTKTRMYSLLHYTDFTLILFGESEADFDLPEFVKVIRIFPKKSKEGYWAEKSPYPNQAILVRPDSYIESCSSIERKTPSKRSSASRPSSKHPVP